MVVVLVATFADQSTETKLIARWTKINLCQATCLLASNEAKQVQLIVRYRSAAFVVISLVVGLKLVFFAFASAFATAASRLRREVYS